MTESSFKYGDILCKQLIIRHLQVSSCFMNVVERAGHEFYVVTWNLKLPYDIVLVRRQQVRCCKS
jgi:hypothetical protein